MLKIVYPEDFVLFGRSEHELWLFNNNNNTTLFTEGNT